MEALGLIHPGFWRSKRVFLTGHTGFKGSWLSIWLASLGANVYGYALEPPTQPSLFEKANIAGIVKHANGDIRDSKALSKALNDSQPNIVIHLAAQPLVLESFRDPVGTYSTNIIGTVNLLEAVRGCKAVRAVVNVTTDKVYLNREWHWGYREDDALGGFDPYSTSKACSDLVTTSYQQSFFSNVLLATARAGNVIGGGDWAADRLVPDCIRAFSSGRKLKIRNPNSVRPWQHVLEPLAGYLLLCERLHDGDKDAAGSWNFGPQTHDSKPVRWIVERMMEEWPGSPGFEVEAGPHPHEANFLRLDYSKASSLLGWNPNWDIKEALKRVLEWHRLTESGMTERQACEMQIGAYMQKFRDSSEENGT